MKDNRNWPKIYFMLILFFTFFSVFIVSMIWATYTSTIDKNYRINECKKLGAEYYDKNVGDCVDNYGRLYILDKKTIHPWYTYILQFIFIIGSLTSSGIIFFTIITEYKKGV